MFLFGSEPQTHCALEMMRACLQRHYALEMAVQSCLRSHCLLEIIVIYGHIGSRKPRDASTLGEYDLGRLQTFYKCYMMWAGVWSEHVGRVLTEILAEVVYNIYIV